MEGDPCLVVRHPSSTRHRHNPPSATLAQHWSSIVLMSLVCWALTGEPEGGDEGRGERVTRVIWPNSVASLCESRRPLTLARSVIYWFKWKISRAPPQCWANVCDVNTALSCRWYVFFDMFTVRVAAPPPVLPGTLTRPNLTPTLLINHGDQRVIFNLKSSNMS